MDNTMKRINGLREHAYVAASGAHIHVVQAGPLTGPPVILLHGFPEFWYGWRYQIPYLADTGYRVWAPDQRGYNLSEKPRPIAAYNLDVLAADVVALIRATARERVFLVGHDWGAAVAWWVAVKHPELLARLVILNVPHPIVMARHTRQSLEQIARSWYIFFFQLPRLPELLFRAGGYRFGLKALELSSRPDTFTNDDMEAYRRAWARPGAVTAMINWYRATRQTRTARLPSLRVSTPTLIIWGARDVALSRPLAPKSLAMCDDGHLVFIERATHWVQHDEPARVNELIHSFLQR